MGDTDRAAEQTWIDAGLLDPDSPQADERRELLAFLTELGVSLDTMVEACHDGQLVTVAGDRLLRPGDTFSVDELSRRSGVNDVAFATELRTATGFPPPVRADEPVCTEDDVEMFRLFEAASEVFSRDELLHFVRALGVSMRRVAEAAAEMFLRDVEASQHVAHATELQRALTNIQAIELSSAATAVFAPMFRAHLVLAIGDARRARRHHHGYETTPLTVGFVDLTGFTGRAGSSTPTELLRLVTWFEATAHDLVTSHGGRLVKLIGDEVMFATVEPDQACAIALALTRIADMPARGGLAHGQVVTSGGDLYGPVVNLASRIADVAVPGEVLVDQAVVDAVRTDPHVRIEIDVEPAGRRQLKGFAEPVRLWSIGER
ncbi:MAG: adenylate/guanylate cyclase domain-containing protein [Acidimicrobiales bacterium]